MVLKIEEIIGYLTEILASYLESQDIKEDITKETVLFGDGSILDSIGLVNFIIDVESLFIDKEIEISLTSETAMSQKRSPFRNIEALAGFIYDQLEDKYE